MFRHLIRALVLRRLLRGPRSRRSSGSPWTAPRRRTPYYAARPRTRTNVRVGGCCLPIPLTMVAGLAAGGHALRRGRR